MFIKVFDKNNHVFNSFVDLEDSIKNIKGDTVEFLKLVNENGLCIIYLPKLLENENTFLNQILLKNFELKLSEFQKHKINIIFIGNHKFNLETNPLPNSLDLYYFDEDLQFAKKYSLIGKIEMPLRRCLFIDEAGEIKKIYREFNYNTIANIMLEDIVNKRFDETLSMYYIETEQNALYFD
jgi:hypothetical protein